MAVREGQVSWNVGADEKAAVEKLAKKAGCTASDMGRVLVRLGRLGIEEVENAERDAMKKIAERLLKPA